MSHKDLVSEPLRCNAIGRRVGEHLAEPKTRTSAPFLGCEHRRLTACVVVCERPRGRASVFTPRVSSRPFLHRTTTRSLCVCVRESERGADRQTGARSNGKTEEECSPKNVAAVCVCARVLVGLTNKQQTANRPLVDLSRLVGRLIPFLSFFLSFLFPLARERASERANERDATTTTTLLLLPWRRAR